MEITFINQSEDSTWENYEQYLRPLLEKTLNLVSFSLDVEVSIVLVDTETIHQYNKDYRNIDRPTDVLSFVDGDVFDGVTSLGDIIISVDACKSQAQEYKHSIKREFLFLVVHGYLHLLGYDHETEDEEKEMLRLQKEILSGIADRFDEEIH
ncbi:MAG: rRNA maturation RNase YbeY [Erysipelothrix sp.]|nr:rRNA maturation RNase YbeY [Erysipelothrix sp.]